MSKTQNIDDLLKNVRRIHMIGIGGAGMAPLAEILLEEGYEISGSDNNPSDTLEHIKSLGIPVYMGHHVENLRGAQMVVHTAALLNDNPELFAARELGIPTFERAQLFGAITRMYSNCIGVCGTHGKTTTTSLLTQILLEAGKDPSAVIGGRLPMIDSNGLVGHSDTIVCEACEYVDTFLNLSPDTVVILNIDRDHMEYFKTEENLIHSFHRFAQMATRAVLYNLDDAKTLRAVEGIEGKDQITFGTSEGADYRAVNVRLYNGAFPEYDLLIRGQEAGHIVLSIPGIHNVDNSLAAIAAAHYNGVTVEQIAQAVRDFRGAGRRFELLGKLDGVTIADDYAHHPAELKVTLTAALEMDYREVWAVFQPFTFSRTYMLLEDFAEVLRLPQHTVMTRIMGSRERNTYGVTTQQLADKIPGSVWFDTFEEVAQYIVDHARPGDLVITLGCGDIYKAAKIMIKKYRARGAKEEDPDPHKHTAQV